MCMIRFIIVHMGTYFVSAVLTTHTIEFMIYAVEKFCIIGGMKVRSQMRLLVAAKSHRERRKLPLRTIVQEANVPISTVQAMMNDTARRLELEDISKLCLWIPCEVGQLLKMEDEAA